MRVLAYPFSALIADYARAATGLAIVGIPLAFADTAPLVTAALGIGATIFVVYALRTVRLHVTRIVVDGDGVRCVGLRRCDIRWRDLSRLRLSYYSTRRDRDNGWLQLDMSGAGARLRVESRIDGFDALVARAVSAVADNGIELDTSTADNLNAMDLSAPLYGFAEARL